MNDLPVVLVVDDDPLVRDIVARLLMAGGYRTLRASSASDAVQRLHEEAGQVQLLLVDFTLEQRDGLVLARYAQIHWPAIRVLLTSGFPHEWLEAEGVLHRDAPYLRKPFTWEELDRQLQALLRAPARPQRLRRSGGVPRQA